MKDRLSISEARRIALAAQGFGKGRPTGPINRGHLKKFVQQNGLIQIDSVNVLVRAHYMPLFSRYGAYPRSLLEDAARGKKRLLFEYWAHEASLLPLESWPLMQWRMKRAANGERVYGALARFGREKRDYIEALFSAIEKNGPMSASELDGQKGQGGWWSWSEAKHAVEYLFWTGRITTAERRASFERTYDVPERVLPKAVIDTPVPSEEDAQRELVRISAKAHGIGTAVCLRDYFRLPPEDTKARIGELVEAGELLPVDVKGWTKLAYLHKDAKLPRRMNASALLSPFDPVVWLRSRSERLFDFHYRIEIYTPADKRKHGYYVLPFLHGDRPVGRVDLKADRPTGRLLVHAAHSEPGAPGDTAEAMAAELRVMATWLGLETIEVARAGDLARALKGAVEAG